MIIYEEYLLEAANLRRQFNSMCALEVYKSHYAVKHAIVAANRHEFQGIEAEDLEFTRSYLYHNELASVDLMRFADIVQHIGLRISPGLDLTQKVTDTIFCTFHIGSFRVVPLYLNYLGQDIALAVDEQTFITQHAMLKNLHDEMKISLGTFDLINVEQAAAGFQIVNTLKGGKNLVFYMDGNTGIKTSQLTRLPFLRSEIQARTGIPLLSYSLKTKIIPVFTYRENDKIFIDFLDPISPAKESKETYIYNTLVKLYDLFSQYLKKYPEQWEGWAYSHNSYTIDEPYKAPPEQIQFVPEAAAVFTFNKRRFIPILSPGKNYFFDKQSRQSLYIPYVYEELVYRLIEKLEVSILDLNDFNHKFYQELIVRGVLLPC